MSKLFSIITYLPPQPNFSTIISVQEGKTSHFQNTDRNLFLYLCGESEMFSHPALMVISHGRCTDMRYKTLLEWAEFK